jgi:protein-S-isoprenylcysteine O-methyltransferase Ste14
MIMPKAIGQILFKLRGIIPLLVLLIGITIDFIRQSRAPDQHWINTNIWYWVCFGISLFGETLRIYTVGYTPKGTSGRNKDAQVADQLNTQGIYSLTRNPLYLANFIIWIGIALVFQNTWFVIGFVIFFAWFYSEIIKTETFFLINKYGQSYLDWAAKTPVFFPRLKGFKPNTRQFNWYKVARKEKNGIAAIFGVFGVIRFAHQAFTGELFSPSFYDWTWYSMGLCGFLLYLILKSLMVFTNWLDNPANRIS